MSTEKKMTFEEAMRRLEGVVAALESDNLEMDKAFELYEQGIKLTKFCEAYLDQKQKLLKAEDNDDI